jgi:hypothetical protein
MLAYRLRTDRSDGAEILFCHWLMTCPKIGLHETGHHAVA